MIEELFRLATELTTYRQGTALYKAAEQKLSDLRAEYQKNG